MGNWTGLNGSSCGDDSQVPGIDIACTSGQLASWNSGRGFLPVGGIPPGGADVGGTALGGVSGDFCQTHTSTTTSTTTSATATAATRPRMR